METLENLRAELIAKLERNARFYRNESTALAEKPERRDNRHLGSQECAMIADLLQQAYEAMKDAEILYETMRPGWHLGND